MSAHIQLVSTSAWSNGFAPDIYCNVSGPKTNTIRSTPIYSWSLLEYAIRYQTEDSISSKIEGGSQ